MTTTSFLHAGRIAAFVGLTFAITWTLWSVAPTLGGSVFLIGVFAPGLVALALTAWTGGGEGCVELLERTVRWRVPWRFYAFALLLVPLVKLAVAVLHRVIAGTWPGFGETNPILLLLATVAGVIGQAGEEIGWRGYLLPRLTERTGLVIASLVTGVIWAAWHLPLFYVQGADTSGQSFPLWMVEVTSLSVMLAWLYWRTGGSLLLTMLMHSAFNNMKDIVPSGGAPPGNPFALQSSLVFRLTALLLAAVAGTLLVRMRGVMSSAGGSRVRIICT